MAIRDITNRLGVTPTHQHLAQSKPQLYSPRKSKPAKFEKAETRMLRSYLEKKDEFVDEEAFLEDMVKKFGPKILQSYPELWTERKERIEKLQAEFNLHIKGCKSFCKPNQSSNYFFRNRKCYEDIIVN